MKIKFKKMIFLKIMIYLMKQNKMNLRKNILNNKKEIFSKINL